MENVFWNPLKSERLKKTRGVSFEEIISSRFIDIRRHPAKENQKILIYEYRSYCWAIPYIQTEGGIFLKTIYPSRKFTKIYKTGGLR